MRVCTVPMDARGGYQIILNLNYRPWCWKLNPSCVSISILSVPSCSPSPTSLGCFCVVVTLDNRMLSEVFQRWQKSLERVCDSKLGYVYMME